MNYNKEIESLLISVNSDKKYHFLKDEGGMFGMPRWIIISEDRYVNEKEIRKNKKIDINNFTYLGVLNGGDIITHINNRFKYWADDYHKLFEKWVDNKNFIFNI